MNARTVKTRQMVEETFRKEIKEFLKSWGAEVTAEDHYSGYPECGEDIRITVSIPAIYNDGICLREYCEIQFNQYFEGKK